MPRFLACRAEVGFDDGSPVFTDDDVDVEIEDGRILLTYFDERGAVVFQGREESPGRYALSARSRPRKAELAKSGAVLEGSWREGDETGSLRIELLGEEAE
jgi:hypothetical protein